MYAVIKTGGKQYKVASGEKLRVELLPAEVGSTISFDEVLMVGEGESAKVGAPHVADAAATRCASSSTAVASTITRNRVTVSTSPK